MTLLYHLFPVFRSVLKLHTLTLFVDRWKITSLEAVLRRLKGISNFIYEISKRSSNLTQDAKRNATKRLRHFLSVLTSFTNLLSTELEVDASTINGRLLGSLSSLLDLVEPILALMRSAQTTQVPFSLISYYLTFYLLIIRLNRSSQMVLEGVTLTTVTVWECDEALNKLLSSISSLIQSFSSSKSTLLSSLSLTALQQLSPCITSTSFPKFIDFVEQFNPPPNRGDFPVLFRLIMSHFQRLVAVEVKTIEDKLTTRKKSAPQYAIPRDLVR